MPPLKIPTLIAFGSLLLVCGILEYIIIAYVHTSPGRQWILPLEAKEGVYLHEWREGQEVGERKRTFHAQDEADLRNQLRLLGNNGLKAAWEQLSYQDRVGGARKGQGGADDVLYDERKQLLSKLDKKLEWLDSMRVNSKPHQDNSEFHKDTDKKTDVNNEFADWNAKYKEEEKETFANFNEKEEGSNVEWNSKEKAEAERLLQAMNQSEERKSEEAKYLEELRALDEHSAWNLNFHSESPVYQPYGPEPLLEHNDELPTRSLSPTEMKGNNILITMRTIKKFHDNRLPLLFNTWLTKVNRSNVFLMTDDRDAKWQRKVWKAGMHYVLSSCTSLEREDRLCCRTGTELAQIFKKGNEHYDWHCHIDDDMYVRIPPLVKLLSHFDGKKDPIYFGRSGSAWDTPRKVLKNSKIGTEGQGYHFAVGGMYCLSRAMLELARPYIVGGRNFTKTCVKTLEPDDVTIGLVAGIALNKSLTRTERIFTHGLHLISTVDPATLEEQVAFSYGFGSFHWGYDNYNAIYVPNALYSFEEDESQFKSLHCHLYPNEPQCVQRSKVVLEALKNEGSPS